MSHLNTPLLGGNAAFDIKKELAKAFAFSQKHHAILAAVCQKMCVGPQPFERDIVRLASPVWLTVTSSSLSAYSRPEQPRSGLYREEGTTAWYLNLTIPYGSAAPEQAGLMVSGLAAGLCNIAILLDELDRLTAGGSSKSSPEFLDISDMLEQMVTIVQTGMVSQARGRIASNKELRALPRERLKH